MLDSLSPPWAKAPSALSADIDLRHNSCRTRTLCREWHRSGHICIGSSPHKLHRPVDLWRFEHHMLDMGTLAASCLLLFRMRWTILPRLYTLPPEVWNIQCEVYRPNAGLNVTHHALFAAGFNRHPLPVLGLLVIVFGALGLVRVLFRFGWVYNRVNHNASRTRLETLVWLNENWGTVQEGRKNVCFWQRIQA